MLVRVVSSAAEFDALAPGWSTLHRLARASAFQSYEWQRAWWRHIGSRNARLRLNILVLEELSELIAIAPFVFETQRVLGLFKLRRLGLLGEGPSDYLDILVRPGKETAAYQAFAAHLARTRRWDLIALRDVPDRSAVPVGFLGALRTAGLRGERIMGVQCPRMTLQPTWAATLAQLPSRHRKRMRRLDRRLDRDFAVSVRWVSHGDDLHAALSSFIHFHQRHWKAEGHGGVFSNAQIKRFHRDVARAFHEKGWLRLAFLSLDARPAAAILAYQVAGELQIYLTASADLDEAGKYSPGMALRTYCMQRAIEEGADVCDFLRGGAQYKYQLGAVDSPNWNLVAFRPHAVLARALCQIQKWSGSGARRLRGVAKSVIARRTPARMRTVPGRRG